MFNGHSITHVLYLADLAIGDEDNESSAAPPPPVEDDSGSLSSPPPKPKPKSKKPKAATAKPKGRNPVITDISNPSDVVTNRKTDKGKGKAKRTVESDAEEAQVEEENAPGPSTPTRKSSPVVQTVSPAPVVSLISSCVGLMGLSRHHEQPTKPKKTVVAPKQQSVAPAPFVMKPRDSRTSTFLPYTFLPDLILSFPLVGVTELLRKTGPGFGSATGVRRVGLSRGVRIAPLHANRRTPPPPPPRLPKAPVKKKKGEEDEIDSEEEYEGLSAAAIAKKREEKRKAAWYSP